MCIIIIKQLIIFAFNTVIEDIHYAYVLKIVKSNPHDRVLAFIYIYIFMYIYI